VGPVDGKVGAKTRAAVRAYQTRAGLLADGEITESLLTHLAEAVRQAKAAPATAPAPTLSSEAIAALLPLATDTVAQLRSEKRHALVIGNGSYRVLGRLKNPTNDARAVAAALSRLGFQVAVVENGSREDLARAVLEHGRRLKAGGAGVLFYAGHAVQVRGNNYLFPVEADPKTEPEVELVSISLPWVMQILADAGNRVNVIILDSCRNNPLQVAFRSAARGIAVVGKAPGGTLILYAAAPDSVAADGSGEYGLFTSELLRHIETPGLKVEDLFKRVIRGVRERSGGAQVPWSTGSLEGDFAFKLP
jgi:uncharacterized caspase-like protein